MKTFNVFIVISLISGSATAANFSFIGNLSGDDAVQEINFEVEGATQEITLRTLSYTGGTNAQGQVITGGGFDPVVSLFNSSTGALIVTRANYDSPLAATLSAGDYTATVTQYSSRPIGPLLADGFWGTDSMHFNSRTSQWALDVSNVESATLGASYTSQIPEPESFAMLLAGLSLLGFMAKRRKVEIGLIDRLLVS